MQISKLVAEKLEKAQAGDAQAQVAVGCFYWNGAFGFAKDAGQAIAWFEKAAQQGNPEGFYILGNHYRPDTGVEKDVQQALHWLGRAIAAGYDKAQEAYQKMRDYMDVEVNAQAGDAKAQYEMGYRYWNEYMRNRSKETIEPAMFWYRKAAEQGHAGAQYMLAMLYDDCYWLDYAERKAKVEFWYQQAAENGHARAQLAWGRLQPRDRRAVWYRKAAEQDDDDAMFALANCYVQGEGVGQDWAQAYQWMKKAAEKSHFKATEWCTEYEKGLRLEAQAESGDIKVLLALAKYYLHNETGVRKQEQAAALLEKVAASGDVDGLCALGEAYEADYSNKQRREQAFACYLKAAQQGHARAQYKLSRLYGDNSFADHDDYLAYYWLEKAAAQGLREAQERLPYMREQEKRHLFAPYHAAAKAGDIEAQYHMAEVYLHHVCQVRIHDTVGKALLWLQAPAEQGMAAAQYELGRLYFRNHYALKKDEAKGLFWLEKSAQQDYVPAQMALGDYFAEVQDVAQAAVWYQRAAAQEEVRALFLMGQYHAQGQGVAQNDRMAADYWRKAARHHHAGAQAAFAQCYIEGRGVNRNDELALIWLQRAAAQWQPEAQYILATWYLAGREVAQDTAQALVLCRSAAQQDYAPAQYLLGDCYQQGVGVAKDAHLAAVWFALAAAKGDAPARERLLAWYQADGGVMRREAPAWL